MKRDKKKFGQYIATKGRMMPEHSTKVVPSKKKKTQKFKLAIFERDSQSFIMRKYELNLAL